MVPCPQCGNEVTEGSELCIHCGAKFNSSADGGAEIGENNPDGTEVDSSSGDDPNMPSNLKDIKLNTSRLKLDLGMNSNSANNNPGDTDGLNNPSEELSSDQNPVSNPGGESEGNSDNGLSEAPMKPSGKSPQQRSKWLEEQEKIKRELEALKGKVSKDFSVNSALDIDEQDDIFKLDDISEEEIQVAAEGLVSRSRPLTPEEEAKKTELLSELNDLKAEGYDVSRLERIVNVDPTGAWNDFVKFMDDIEILQNLRKRYSDLDTTGFEHESQSIRKKLDNPDLILQIERELNDLESKLSSGGGRTSTGGLDELIDAGKEAFRMMEYQKALNFYESALKIDPNNREVEFYKKKAEAKLQALSTMGPDTGAMAGEGYGGGGGYSPRPVAGQIPMKQPTTPSGSPPMQRRVRKVAAGRAPVQKAAAGAPGQPAGRAPIPTGGTVSVKQPLSVSMTPKVPAKKKVKVQPRAPTPAGGGRPKVMPVKRTGVAPRPAPAPAPAPAPVSPGDAAKIEGLGFNAFINKDYAKALEYYEQVLAINPNYPGAASQRDKCLEALGMK
jgi:tetratricopeptide (TPR) repeat protein